MARSAEGNFTFSVGFASDPVANAPAPVKSPRDPGSGTNAPNLTELTAWNQYWNQTNTGSAHLRRRRDRPFLSSRAESLTASASQQSSWLDEQIAAASGNLSIPYGAALELVGPGPAYDTWRRSPEYQQWQERIERLRSRRSQHVSGQ